MLVFIVPLKSKKVSESWDQVSRLLERTLRSICNQTSQDFRVIVVCHEKPNIEFKHPNISYVEVDFPSPADKPAFRPDYETDPNCETDKGRKILKGLIYAKRFNPTHVMSFDADDCVSKHLARFVNVHPARDNWYVNKGYRYQEGRKFMLAVRYDFYQKCGSCNIIKYSLLNLPENPEYNRGYGYYIPYLLDHDSVRSMLLEWGTPIKQLPFFGVVQITKTGENLSIRDYENRFYMTFFKGLPFPENIFTLLRQPFKIFNYRLLTKSIRDEFGLHDL